MIEIKVDNEIGYTTVAGEKNSLKNELLNKLPDYIDDLLDSICATYSEKADIMKDFQMQVMKSATFSKEAKKIKAKKTSGEKAGDALRNIMEKVSETQTYLCSTVTIPKTAKESAQTQQSKSPNLENSSTPKTKEDIIKMLEDDLHLLSFLQEDKSLTVKEYCQIVAQKLAISEFLLEAKSNYYCM